MFACSAISCFPLLRLATLPAVFRLARLFALSVSGGRSISLVFWWGVVAFPPARDRASLFRPFLSLCSARHSLAALVFALPIAHRFAGLLLLDTVFPSLSALGCSMLAVPPLWMPFFFSLLFVTCWVAWVSPVCGGLSFWASFRVSLCSRLRSRSLLFFLSPMLEGAACDLAPCFLVRVWWLFRRLRVAPRLLGWPVRHRPLGSLGFCGSWYGGPVPVSRSAPSWFAPAFVAPVLSTPGDLLGLGRPWLAPSLVLLIVCRAPVVLLFGVVVGLLAVVVPYPGVVGSSPPSSALP